MKAGLATPEQLRKARAERRREQRHEARGKRNPADGSGARGSGSAVRSRTAPRSASASGRKPDSRQDDARSVGGDESGRHRRDGARLYRGRSGRRQDEGARERPPASPPDQEPSVQALNLRIRELLDRHAMNDRRAEIAFNFRRENVIRRVYVTDEQRGRLAGGELAVVGFRRRHHIVPASVADEIQALRPIVFVYRALPSGDAPVPGAAPDGSEPDSEDPYRDFPVPDDLHW